MSAQSGISVDEQLLESFNSMRLNGGKRLLKVNIVDEKMIECDACDEVSDFQADFDKTGDYLEDQEPCYLIYRTDKKGDQGFDFVLLAYVPDVAKVRKKMLYASSREALKRELGKSYFVEEIYGTVKGDFTLEGYLKHMEHQQQEAPLTEQEEIHKETRVVMGTLSGESSFATVQFPLTPEAESALDKIKNKEINFIQLVVNQETENIDFVEERTAEAGNLQSLVNQKDPRFYFFNYAHNHEGEDLNSCILILCVPDKSPIKSRMTYATVKMYLMELCATLEIAIDLKLEIFNIADLTEEHILEELHPKKVEEKKTFKKPSRPGKGGARLMRK
eukprot:GCRY01000749.1.p1 GENE.GCRY01000749.1~~GCRY01000749.1.p1  ORF type:complete len:333 (+),score=57.87 GCRY01000749.1:143-1141(+)